MRATLLVYVCLCLYDISLSVCPIRVHEYEHLCDHKHKCKHYISHHLLVNEHNSTRFHFSFKRSRYTFVIIPSTLSLTYRTTIQPQVNEEAKAKQQHFTPTLLYCTPDCLLFSSQELSDGPRFPFPVVGPLIAASCPGFPMHINEFL